MIVLDPRHAASGATLGLFGRRVREAQIHRTVAIPELGAVLVVMDEHVTQRPQRLVREAVVVRIDFVVLQPDPTQRIGFFARRHHQTTRCVRGLRIRGTRTPCHPCSMNASHGGIESGHQTASGLLDLDALDAAHVLVWLAIRDENELAVAEVTGEVGHRRG